VVAGCKGTLPERRTLQKARGGRQPLGRRRRSITLVHHVDRIPDRHAHGSPEALIASTAIVFVPMINRVPSCTPLLILTYIAIVGVG
jgi:hypothetical protein